MNIEIETFFIPHPFQKKTLTSQENVEAGNAALAKEISFKSIHTTNPDFFKILKQTKVENFYEPNTKILFAFKKDSLKSVWAALVEHNYMAVPLLSKQLDKYNGFIDMADIVSYLFKLYEKAPDTEKRTFWEVLASSDFLQVPVHKIRKQQQVQNIFHPVNIGFSMLHALELFAKERGLHRIPVINEKQVLINLITQSQLIRYLNANLTKLGSISAKPLFAISSLFKPVLSIFKLKKAEEAFFEMHKQNVTGLAVINADGSLWENISIRDVKAIGLIEKHWRFEQTVKAYLRHVREEFEIKHGRPHTVVTVNRTTTLGEVITLMSENRVHRVYIVDDLRKPIGICSIKAVCREIFED